MWRLIAYKQRLILSALCLGRVDFEVIQLALKSMYNLLMRLAIADSINLLDFMLKNFTIFV